MQLSAPRAALSAALLCLSALASSASAQVQADITATAYRESGGPLNITVINPQASLNIPVGGGWAIHGGYQADIVSGASVAVVDAPGGEVDAVTSATTLDDIRHVPNLGFSVEADNTRLSMTGTSGWESDYRSNGFAVSAGTDLFGRNTQLDVTYASSWDKVCDVAGQSGEPAERVRMPSSTGCFEKGSEPADGERVGRDEQKVRMHTVQGTWTQAWAPLFNTQLLLTTQVLDGFQSNPYRAVWLGRTAAQEHHPRHRARYAAGLRARVWLKPIGGALQLFGRAYRDTWDVQSLTGQLAYERGLWDQLRFRIRGRYYTQTGAAFYSDDYLLQPAGQYFTGDRELSPMDSWLVGGRLEYSPEGDDEGDVAGIFSELRLVLKVSVMWFDFSEFHYGSADVPNRRALFGTLALNTAF